MNELTKGFESLARAHQGLARTLGIWGLYALCLGKNSGPVASPVSAENYLAEVARAERQLAKNQSLPVHRVAQVFTASCLATTAVEERV